MDGDVTKRGDFKDWMGKKYAPQIKDYTPVKTGGARAGIKVGRVLGESFDKAARERIMEKLKKPIQPGKPLKKIGPIFKKAAEGLKKGNKNEDY